MSKFRFLGWLGLIIGLLGLAACSNKATQPNNNAPSPATATIPIPSSAITLVPNTNFSSSTSSVSFLEQQTLASGQGKLTLNITMPFGYKFNGTAPFTMSLNEPTHNVTFDPIWSNYQQVDPIMPLEIPLTLTTGNTFLNLNLTIYWCEAINQTLCFVERRELALPLNVVEDATETTASIELALLPPDVSGQ